MTVLEYDQLKQELLLSVGTSDNHSDLIHLLKDFYKDNIDSERRFEFIKSLGQLLKVLEIRDVLSEDNVAPLKEICRRIGNNELLRQITAYEYALISGENKLNRHGVQKSLDNKEFTQTPILNLYENLSPRKIQRINETLVEELGTFWRDLARYLRIPEGVIDDIDTKYQTLSDKARMLLSHYERKRDPQRWFFILCEALEKARRKDLSRSLQEIMTMNL